MMAAGKSAAVALWELLETGAPVPHGTGHIVVDARLSGVMARRTRLPADAVFEVFCGLPVKEARGVLLGSIMRAPEEERIGFMRRWRDKRDRERFQEGAA